MKPSHALSIAVALGTLAACTQRARLPPPSMPLIATSQVGFPAPPPLPSLLPDVRLPIVHTLTLANGLRVYLVARPGAEEITLQYLARAGGEDTTLAQLGLSTLAVRATVYAADQLRERASHGPLSAEAPLRTWTGRTAAVLAASAHAETLEATLAELAAILRLPSLSKEAIDSAANEQLDALHDSLFFQAGLARAHALQMLYGDEHPLGHPTAGLHENLARFKVDELERHRRRILAPDTSAILLVGDVPPLPTLQLVAKYVGGIPAVRAEPLARTPRTPTEKRARALFTPGSNAHVVEAFRAPAREDPDFVPFRLLSIVTGELTSSRLFDAIRLRQQQTYSIHSDYRPRREDGNLLIETEVNPEVLEATLHEIDAELTRLRSEPITEAELARAKLQARERLAVALESDDGTTGLYSTLLCEASKLPTDPSALLHTELARIDQTTPAQIQDVAARYLQEQRGVAVSGPVLDVEAALHEWADGEIDTFVPKRIADRLR